MTNTALSFAISVGHDRAAEISEMILIAGGNAVDAGIAATIALTVLHSEQVQLGGVAPMLVHMAQENKTYSVEGAGRWPAVTKREFFAGDHGGKIPQGIHRSVVPAAPHAWISALARFGSMGFAELATPALELARDGFAAHDDLVACTTRYEKYYRQFETNTRIWLPDDAPLKHGQVFVQSDLAVTLEALIAADRKGAAAGGRLAGLSAVIDEFYGGEIAATMVRHVEDHGGWLSAADLSGHRTPIVYATVADVFEGQLFSCGPWSQGPALSQALQIIEQHYLKAGTVDDVSIEHIALEALKLAFADREAYYGDPDFVDVPISTLLSKSYATERSHLVDVDLATARLPAAGRIDCQPAPSRSRGVDATQEDAAVDTSIAAVVDSEGNIFSATPSDMSFDGPAVPGLGFVISTRGAQSYFDEKHPASLQPGKRPRVSACPFIFMGSDKSHIAGGGPGADLQLQAAVQVLARHLQFGTDLKEAIRAPRVFTQSAPTSSEPHLAFIGRVLAEDGISDAVAMDLSQKGHVVKPSGAMGISNPSLCVVSRSANGKLSAHGDHRRASGQRVRNLN